MHEEASPEVLDRETSAVDRLKKLYQLSMTLSGEPVEIFEHIAGMIGELMDVNVVCLSEVRGDELYFLSVYDRGELHRDAGKCPLEVTPCATVEATRDYREYEDVARLFPKASFLAEHHAYSYCGFPALDNDGNVVAVTCLLDERPHTFDEDDHDILRLFGQRIGMEIERQRHVRAKAEAEAELLRHRDQLEQLVAERTAELERAQQELVRSDRLATLGRLTATVSHELRNPLGTIRSSVHTIETRLGSAAESMRVERALGRVQRSVTRCDRIIDELLSFTRDKKLRCTTQNLDDWLSEIVEEMNVPAGVVLSTELAAQTAVRFDTELLRQALTNVIENARDAVATVEEERKRIVVRSRAENAGIRVEVEDSGCGVAADSQPHVFEPLFSTKSFGVGLGMCIVEQIVEAHGGTVEFESKESEGTKVILVLPGLVS